MAAERQKPAQLDWRKPAWAWAPVALLLGGPLNPLVLGILIVAVLGRASEGVTLAAYCIAAGTASVAMVVAIMSWMAPAPSLPRTAQALALSVMAVAIGLAISAAVTLGVSGPATPSLDDRINLALAVLMLSIVAGAIIAASSAMVFRCIALRWRRRKSRSRSRVVRPREIGAPPVLPGFEG